MKRLTAVLLVAAMVMLAGAPALEAASKDEVKSSIDRGLKWLRTQREPGSGWNTFAGPGITALVLTAYTESPRAYTEADGPFIREPVQYLLSCQQEDGGIYTGHLPTYNTNVSLLALWTLKNPEYEGVIQKAQLFVDGVQCDESGGYGPQDKFYGGIGYGSDERPDLSNLQLSIEALTVTCYDTEAELWGKALKFLERCQNFETNDQEWAGDDGGFVYYPGNSPAGEIEDGTVTQYRSYGSMTYAGVKSFIYAGLEQDDPRVRAALNWIGENYTLDQNYPIGDQGLFYYYHTFAKTFSVLGEPEFRHGEQTYRWADDVASKLMSLQKDEGYWVNDGSARWWEGDPVLATAYAILALEKAYPFLEKAPTP